MALNLADQNERNLGAGGRGEEKSKSRGVGVIVQLSEEP